MEANDDIAVADGPSQAQRGGEGLEGLYGRPGFKIRRAHQTAVAVFAAATAELNITTSQYGVLHVVAFIPGLDQITLARLIGLDRSTTSMVLGLLEQRGLIERAQHETDRRRRVLKITDAGRKLHESAQGPVARAISRLMKPVASGERGRVLDLLEHIVASATAPVERPAAELLRELYRRPGFLIRRAHQVSTAIFTEECGRFDITQTQFGMLFVLHQRPNLDQVTVARLARFDHSTNRMVVDLLEARGFIERRVDIIDRRRRVLNLTPAGRRLLNDLTPFAQRARQRLVKCLTGPEADFLLSRLDTIVAHFEKHDLV